MRESCGGPVVDYANGTDSGGLAALSLYPPLQLKRSSLTVAALLTPNPSASLGTIPLLSKLPLFAARQFAGLMPQLQELSLCPVVLQKLLLCCSLLELLVWRSLSPCSALHLHWVARPLGLERLRSGSLSLAVGASVVYSSWYR